MDGLKRWVEAVISPTGITAILIGTGLIISFTKRRAKIGRRLVFSGGVLFLILLLTPIADLLFWNLEKQYPPMLKPPRGVAIDRIVVLSGYAEENYLFPITTTVSERTIGSMAEGMRLYRCIPGVKLIVSGGVVRKGERSLGAAMSDFLQQMGVPAEDIIVEGSSRNTYENLLELRKLISTRPFILVAQAADIRRAMAVARKLDMNPLAAPACYRVLPSYTNSRRSNGLLSYLEPVIYPSTDNLSRIQWAFHEYVGYVWYRLLGRI